MFTALWEEGWAEPILGEVGVGNIFTRLQLLFQTTDSNHNFLPAQSSWQSANSPVLADVFGWPGLCRNTVPTENHELAVVISNVALHYPRVLALGTQFHTRIAQLGMAEDCIPVVLSMDLSQLISGKGSRKLYIWYSIWLVLVILRMQELCATSLSQANHWSDFDWQLLILLLVR